MKPIALFILLAAQAAGGYSYVRPITLDHTKAGGATHADFPVLVAGTFPWLATTANGGKVESASGNDVAFLPVTGCRASSNTRYSDTTRRRAR